MSDPYSYTPRPVIAEPILEYRRWRIKPYRISLPDPAEQMAVQAEPLDAILVPTLDNLEPNTEKALGFAILHRGQDGTYLLVGWWVGGHNLASHTYRVDRDHTGAFLTVPFPLFACVWEMAVYAFERDRWVDLVMAAHGARHAEEAYLAARLEGVV